MANSPAAAYGANGMYNDPNQPPQPGTYVSPVSALGAQPAPSTVSAGNGTYGTFGASIDPSATVTGGGSPTPIQSQISPAASPSMGSASSSSTPAAPTPGVLSGPGFGENWYSMYGNDINQPTNSQKLFDMGPGATNPLYNNAIDLTNRGIDASTAARGIYDSSAAIGSIGLADAGIRGQQVQDYENLAGQADTANTGAYNAASGAAEAAQNNTQNRINAITQGSTALSTAQASIVDNFYQMAESGQLTADMASIEAAIQASGVDAATAQAFANDLTSFAGSAMKAATAGK